MLARLFAAAVLASFVMPAQAADDPPKFAGLWEKEADGNTLSIQFKKEGELDFKVALGDSLCTMACTYTVDKDGLLKAKMTKKTLKGDFPIELKDGFTFQFKLKVVKDVATVSDYDASEHAEAGKGAVEGEYKKKEDK